VVIAEDDSLITLNNVTPTNSGKQHLITMSTKHHDNLRVSMLGYSESSDAIITRLLQSNQCTVSLFNNDMNNLSEMVQNLIHEKRIHFSLVDTGNSDQLNHNDVHKSDVIIITDKDYSNPCNSDLKIIKSILATQNAISTSEKPHVIAELNSADSRDMMASLYDLDFVVSDKIGSKIIAQYTENPQLIKVIDALVSTGGHGISLRKISITDQEIQTFANLRATLNKDVQLIGLHFMLDGKKSPYSILETSSKFPKISAN